MKPQKIQDKRYRNYTWGVLGFNIAVILWGALVRATGSGAGCGGNWPLCKGEVFLPSSQVETIIEYTHRATSGIAFVMVAILLVWTYRRFPRASALKKGAAWSMVFMITEALLGAGLVLFGWVVDNTSLARVIVQVVHLLNTHFLLGALTYTAWAASGKELALWKLDRSFLPLLAGMAGILIMSGAGAVTALGDTIFPAGTLAEGIQADFSPTAHFLVRLRVWHPILALVVGFYLLVLTRLSLLGVPRGSTLRRLGWGVMVVYGLQVLGGILNIYLLAPVWMQIIHLALADAIWITYLLFSNEKFLHARQPA